MTEDASSDHRLDFAKQYVLKSLKLKSDKWDKMKSIEDNETLLNEFLESSDAVFLIFFVSSTGQLTPLNQFPASTKNKTIYFIKHKREPVQPGKLQQICFYGDLSYAPLDHLAGLVDQVTVASWSPEHDFCAYHNNNIYWYLILSCLDPAPSAWQ